MGNGKQWWSWIALTDVVNALQRLILDENLRGPVNLVAPNPATNLDFTRSLARVLRRPALFPLPAGAVKFFLGEMGVEMLLASARVLPKQLEERGFQFQWPELEVALRAELG